MTPTTTCTCPPMLRTLEGRCVVCTDDDAPLTTPAIRKHPRAVAIERELCRKSFSHFVERYWPVVTGAPYVSNRGTRAIVAALQSVADGDCTRLLIAIAPGTGKSTLLALYAAWRLARDPSWRSIHASHAYDLAATESRRVRRLVESDEFRSMFAVELRTDENAVGHWSTTKDGRYFAVGRDTALTGRRAHEAICDDPLNAADRFSKAERDGVYTWFTEGLSTRLDGDRAPMIVVQQRLDRDDLLGRLAESGTWTLVELPAEFEDGELLAPNVLPREKLDALKAQIGASTYATQYLQRPADDDSAIVKRAWWRFHHAPHVAVNAPRPLGCDTTVAALPTPSKFDAIVIACDLTFGTTHAKGDYAVCEVWGSVGTARYLIDLWRARATQLEQRNAIKMLAAKYPSARILVEKAAGGAGAIEELHADGLHNVVPVLTGGRSKLERISVVSPTIENGLAILPLGAPWLSDFVEELAGATRHDDLMDAAAYALHELNTASTAIADERASIRRTLVMNDCPRDQLDAKVDAIIARKYGGAPTVKAVPAYSERELAMQREYEAHMRNVGRFHGRFFNGN
jgi:predicted phage terminase large subunit-like protein